MQDFSRDTLKALAQKGVSVLRPTLIPSAGDMPFASGTRGYVVDDNGVSRIWTFSQVLNEAR